MKKVILITGASSGIGKETARYFAAKGWNVIATMRSPEKETELTKLDNVLVTKLDVQNIESIKSAITAGISHFGQIDVLVNNAGYGQMGIFEAAARQQIVNQFEVNVFGVMDTIKAILPHFRERGKGMIVNISSGAGKFTLPMLSMYAASKFALEGFSEALSFELSALNIKVKIVEPGGTQTNFNQASADVFAHDASLTDYDPFLAAAGKMFDTMKQASITSIEVAEVIYKAITDGTDTLRYAIGNADFNQRMNARRQMEDQEYIDSIKNGFVKYLQQ
ncbi:MAG: SDR family oxidoreductase [Mucilaginibacter sp.]|uniref:SDR family oxidoreductase n=1 Tax=Mucilaginibacter sp. TaxID=1882438 RepID=UPI0031AD5963